jgi:uncharacterized protein DUF3558
VEATQEVVRLVEGPASARALPVLSVNVRLSVVIAVLSMVVVSGCTVATAGTPQAASTTTSGGLPSDGAPKVENPLDVSHFEEKPCDALTTEDAKELNVPATGEQSDNGVGQTCAWNNGSTGGALGLSFLSKDKRGLSSVYREAKGSDWPFFEPIDDIEGHPAVAYSPKQKNPTTDCAIGIGVTDQLSIAVYAALSDANVGKRNPCEAATQAAGMLMRTMEAA